MSKLKNSIGTRIAKLIALATVASVLFAATVLIVLRVNSELDGRRAALEATAYALASAAGDAASNNNRQAAMSALTAISRVPHIDMAAIIANNGSTLASLGNSAYLTDDVISATDDKWALLYKGKLPVAVNIIKGGVPHGQLIMVGDISTLRSQLVMTILTAFAVAFFVALLGVLASRPLQLRIPQPLAHLTQAMQNIRTSRDYSVNLQDDNSEDENGILTKAFNGMMQDIRFRDQSLQKLAYNDPLTGLPNRLSFQRSVTDWLSIKYQPTYGSILLVNIVGFRSINDAFSHSIGDAVLMTVAATIKSALPEDVTLARYGGDEFAMLLPATIAEVDVEMYAARIQSAFFKPLHIGDLDLHIGLTAGAVMLNEESDADAALRHADLALTEARHVIANRVQFFQNHMAETVQNETALGQALRQAAMAGAFELHFQPQLDVQQQQISGFEALIRWKHPTQGAISPAIFIPLAESIGLVSVIGDWVLFEGCRQAATWHRQGQNDRVMSINISSAQILTAGFVEKVRSALHKSGLPPKLLCLELTESIFVGSRYAETVVILETLAKDGIKLALDDFGTGYSSLSYLAKLPFHIIKIDRAFVSHIDKNERKKGMLKSIVEMVHALQMTVVAEGAETQAELQLLQTMGVNKVQGYVVARPMPAQDALNVANAIDHQNKAMSA